MTTHQTLGLLSAAAIAACASIPPHSQPAPTQQVAAASPSNPSDDDASVSTTLTTTAGREEAVNPPAVASLEQPAAVTPAPVSEPSRPAWPYKPIPVPAYVPRGHYESRGLFGRQQVWVTDRPQQQYQQHAQYQYRSYGSCGPGGCGRR
jgi:hypothetical protein